MQTFFSCLLIVSFSLTANAFEIISPGRRSFDQVIKTTAYPSGIHAHTLGDIELQATSLELTTNFPRINIRTEQLEIENQLKDLRKICDYTENNDKVRHHCRSVHEKLQQDSEKICGNIFALYDPARKKRTVGAVIKIVTKIATVATSKWGSRALLLGTVAYQAYEQHQLEGEVFELRQRLKTMGRQFLEANRQHYDAVQRQLQDSANQQSQLQTIQQIDEYANEMRQMLDNMEKQHRELDRLEPIDELRREVDALNEGQPTFKIPNIPPSQLFGTTRPRRTKNPDGTINLIFSIPLASTEKFTEMLLIDTYAETADRVIFTQDRRHFAPLDTMAPNKTFYAALNFEPATKCQREVLTSKLSGECEPNTMSYPPSSPKTITLTEDLHVIFNRKFPNTISCNRQLVVIPPSAATVLSGSCPTIAHATVYDEMDERPLKIISRFVTAPAPIEKVEDSFDDLQRFLEDDVFANRGFSIFSYILFFAIFTAATAYIIYKAQRCFRSQAVDRRWRAYIARNPRRGGVSSAAEPPIELREQ